MASQLAIVSALLLGGLEGGNQVFHWSTRRPPMWSNLVVLGENLRSRWTRRSFLINVPEQASDLGLFESQWVVAIPQEDDGHQSSYFASDEIGTSPEQLPWIGDGPDEWTISLQSRELYAGVDRCFAADEFPVEAMDIDLLNEGSILSALNAESHWRYGRCCEVANRML